MGALADKANQQSKFLILEKGESKVLRFKSYKFVSNYKDPEKEDVQYCFEELFIDGAKPKYWTNGNGRIMKYMDSVPPGSMVVVTRNKFISKDGVEDPNKSTYTIVRCDDRGQPIGEGANE